MKLSKYFVLTPIRTHSKAINKDLYAMRKEAKLSDLQFICQETKDNKSVQIINAHQAMFSNLSKMLKELFSIAHEKQFYESIAITLESVDNVIVEKLMQYIYLGRTTVDHQQKCQLTELCSLLHLEIPLRYMEPQISTDQEPQTAPTDQEPCDPSPLLHSDKNIEPYCSEIPLQVVVSAEEGDNVCQNENPFTEETISAKTSNERDHLNKETASNGEKGQNDENCKYKTGAGDDEKTKEAEWRLLVEGALDSNTAGPFAKKSRIDPFQPSAGTSPSFGTSITSKESSPEEVKRYLDKNPMATAKVVRKIKSKRSKMTKYEMFAENRSGFNAERKRKEKRKLEAEKAARKEKKEKSGERKEKRVKEKRMTKLPRLPKKNQSVYFLWMNANRKRIMKDHPGLSVIEISKKASEMWKKLEDKSEWNIKAEEDKKRYIKELEKWKAEAEEALKVAKKKAKKEQGAGSSKKPKESKPSSSKTGLHFKSK